jgi:AraC-like DNA-binding protein
MLIQRVPAPPLDAFVAVLWASDRGALPHARERKLPTGCVDIVIPLHDHAEITRFAHEADTEGQVFRAAIVQGAHDRAIVRGTGGPSCVVGVHFRPGGAAALLGGALPELHNCTIALDGVWGAEADRLREELQQARDVHERLRRLEQHLLRRLAGATPDPFVTAVLQAFRQGAPAVTPVQRASGLSPPTFIARFEQATGLTPKRFLRVRRFHALLRRIATSSAPDWAEAALDAGYSDQPHLIREFGRLAGITPSAYRPVSPDQPEHMALEKHPRRTGPAGR